MTEGTQVGSADNKTKVPFGTWKTFKTFIESDLKAKAVPAKIDTSVIGKKSGTDQRGLRDGMRFWGLVKGDSQETTDKLRLLVDAFGTDRWKASVLELLQSYDPIVANLDLTKATQKELDDAFKVASGYDGSTIKKAVRLYLAMATEAGVKLSPFFVSLRGMSDGAEPSSPSSASTQPANGGNASRPKGKRRAKGSSSSSTDTGDMRTPEEVDAIQPLPGNDFRVWIPKQMEEGELEFALNYLANYLKLTRQYDVTFKKMKGTKSTKV